MLQIVGHAIFILIKIMILVFCSRVFQAVQMVQGGELCPPTPPTVVRVSGRLSNRCKPPANRGVPTDNRP